jgi:glutamate N-acetyltransferase/amino-acid N-acetyltransferase
MDAARSMAQTAAEQLGCTSTQVAVCSTGVIGVQLPLGLVTAGIHEAAENLDSTRGADAAEAIMTTDTFPKEVAISVTAGGRTFTVGGMAKGSGMIHPDMATMLAFITTDAPLTSGQCDAVLREAVGVSFNRITVDSDTSTNDACILMASGAEGGPVLVSGSEEHDAVRYAVREVAVALAQMLIRDGAGATKFVTVTVRGARSEPDAERAAFAIATSPLVKTAIFGRDANWGRVAMAVGKSGSAVDAARLEIVFAGILTCLDGTAVPFDEREASAALDARDIEILVDLHLGEAEATVWTCDLSYEYVRINGEYRS